MKNVILTFTLSVSSIQLSHTPSTPLISIFFSQTHQDGGDYIGPVQQSISVIAASYEAGCGHILLIFIPVAHLGKKLRVFYI